MEVSSRALHGLILNAGVFGPTNKITSDGYEAHFGINHLAHFILMKELLPVLRSSSPSRIVIVSSMLSKHTCVKQSSSIEKKLEVLCPKDASEWYFRLYAKSKMCNMLTAFKLHRDEFKNGISVYSIHPGSGVRTDLHRDFGFWSITNFLSIPFTKDASQGAATSVYCATHPEVANISGKYWESCWDDEKNLDKSVARDEELQDSLWKYSEELIRNENGKSDNDMENVHL
uniref:Retinol dehydrogenase 14 n=1 Tax=Caenorhabditis tropicalis TaxID=1561998 RepID=A0A1I7T314_9PELO